MNASRAKPKRPLKNDLYSLAAVMAVPFAVMLAFPYSAVGFSAATRSLRPAGCAFVILDADMEERAVEAARSAWKGVSARELDESAELGLLSPTLPEYDFGPLVSMDDMIPGGTRRSEKYDGLPMPPSMAAKKPQKLLPAKSAEDDALAFPKGEMLKMEFHQ